MKIFCITIFALIMKMFCSTYLKKNNPVLTLKGFLFFTIISNRRYN